MKKRILISLALALSLVAVLAVPAMAATPVAATVEVSEHISATITDNLPTGLQFGTMVQGQSDAPEAAQVPSYGAVTIQVAAETNVDCDIDVMAANFTDGGKILAITNAKYGTSDALGAATAFAAANTDYLLDQSTAGFAKTVEVYHWLSIPALQEAGSYSSTFTYNVSATIA